MVVLNFSHPITEVQKAVIEEMVGGPITVIDIRVHITFDVPLSMQCSEIISGIQVDWQSDMIVVRPAALDSATLTLMAEMHGRCGHFLPILTFRRSAGGFEPWEIVDLQVVRDAARMFR